VAVKNSIRVGGFSLLANGRQALEDAAQKLIAQGEVGDWIKIEPDRISGDADLWLMSPPLPKEPLR